MKIYTKKGDKGSTSMIGRSAPKSDHAVEVLGDLDELNAWLGMAAGIATGQVRDSLRGVQSSLLSVGAEIASSAHTSPIIAAGVERDTQGLEDRIDEMERGLPPLTGFLLPGGGELSARVHVARSVCRRAERAFVRLAESETVRPELLAYVNRLSDWLFVLARWSAYQTGEGDILWNDLRC